VISLQIGAVLYRHTPRIGTTLGAAMGAGGDKGIAKM
jgi:hypothetical protein